jgi:outer membrane protein OmpA-like peptidoglycan-associated protein
MVRVLPVSESKHNGCVSHSSAHGLIVSISDVLFGFNECTLTVVAREELSKIAGILVSYGNLSPRLEAYIDNIGGDQYNLWLSTKRAQAVRDYLISQGVSNANLTARGFGEANPVASNTTTVGRQQNRRVELVIPGEAIGIT